MLIIAPTVHKAVRMLRFMRWCPLPKDGVSTALRTETHPRADAVAPLRHPVGPHPSRSHTDVRGELLCACCET
ncbi:hypothetical protein GCM10010365_17710 [Streptomyces poonensis]|uniref:Uncharacterized protein n=1 Tax=Streptomyces poonensis TaxID=68255 RepID=A0A918PDA8_9ACTN|nr:hypothetical protein GCM10010365_17710 [Streptomyces poonensis]